MVVANGIKPLPAPISMCWFSVLFIPISLASDKQRWLTTLPSLVGKVGCSMTTYGTTRKRNWFIPRSQYLSDRAYTLDDTNNQSYCSLPPILSHITSNPFHILIDSGDTSNPLMFTVSSFGAISNRVFISQFPLVLPPMSDKSMCISAIHFLWSDIEAICFKCRNKWSFN